jgi:hypothetical protein
VNPPPGPGILPASPSPSPSRITAGRITGLGVLIAAVLLPVATATAYWSAQGAGAGTPGTGSTAMTAEAGSVRGLYPGRSSTVAVTARNRGSRSFMVHSLTGGTVSVTGATGSCDATAVSLTPRSGLSSVVPSGGFLVMKLTVTMSTSAEDGCQGATFSLPVTVDGRQL